MNDESLKLESQLEKIHSRIFRNYLYNLTNNYETIKFDNYNRCYVKNNEGNDCVVERFPLSILRGVKITRWVYDKKEQIIDRFKNIYTAFSSRRDSLALVVKRNITGTEMFFVTHPDVLSGGNDANADNALELLKSAIIGNFPGTIMKNYSLNSDEFFGLDEFESVSVLTNIASEKSEKHISQGLEKLLNGLVPSEKDEEYVLIFLAEPINHHDILAIKNGYEELASSIIQYAEYQTNTSNSLSTADGKSDSTSHTDGTNESIAKTHGMNVGLNANVSMGKGWLNGLTDVFKKSTPSFGGSIGYQYSKTTTKGTSESDTVTSGTNYCLTKGTSEGEIRTFKSYPIANLLARIEKQIERMEKCEAMGMWRHATYICATNSQTSTNVANYLLGLFQGDESFVEAAVINTWTQDSEILNFVKRFTHPVFANKNDMIALKGKVEDPIRSVELITPTTYVTTAEVAQTMAFPYKSVQGLSSIECAEFERNILLKENTDVSEKHLKLGYLYHMHTTEKHNMVELDINNLTKHTFVTGSTGSGKSTTVYKILHEAQKEKIPFLVVEPAKGEYKDEFEHLANVYGTNPLRDNLLQMNPFSFPCEGVNAVHISEHIDRLIEIFNACWPMYAAMPAVLKEAVERAYLNSGWDLIFSTNSISNNLFPTFSDVLQQLYIVIENSDFSQELKSNYSGALITRVKSLTNGINGLVLSDRDIDVKILFEQNTIVDLSRIGSTETKSLIMGLIVMKMQEYHLSSSKPIKCLKHITVLEEAHHLLKKTNSEQSQESANLTGKSVEMISNAIAEMRTYGEGFIIVDQSPGLLDMSVIRNTNTKIIMSLPDYTDRELVGRSVGLNDEQIIEVAKLARGKAVVYQNNWVAPVLCDIKEFSEDEKLAEKNAISAPINSAVFNRYSKDIIFKYADIIIHNKLDCIDPDEILRERIPASAKCRIIERYHSKLKFSDKEKRALIFDMFATSEIRNLLIRKQILNNAEGLNKWRKELEMPSSYTDDLAKAILLITMLELQDRSCIEAQNIEKIIPDFLSRR